MVENSSTAEFFAKTFNPCGPIIVPETINPIMPGILIFLRRIGDKRMINRMVEKIRTGFLSGKSNSTSK